MENNNCSVYVAKQSEIINGVYRFLLSTTGKNYLKQKNKRVNNNRVQFLNTHNVHVLSPLKEIQESYAFVRNEVQPKVMNSSSTSGIAPKNYYYRGNYLRMFARVAILLILLLVFRKLNKSSSLLNIIKYLSNILFFKFHVF